MIIIYSHLLLHYIVCFGKNKSLSSKLFYIISFLFFLYMIIGFQIGEVALFVRGCCCCQVASVVLTLQPHRRQPTRLLCPQDSPGNNTGVRCHFLFPSKRQSLNLILALFDCTEHCLWCNFEFIADADNIFSVLKFKIIEYERNTVNWSLFFLR